MSARLTQRCARHADREAAAKCLSCGGAFCRECVTEYAGRMTCVDCLKKLTGTPGRKRPAGKVLETLGLVVSLFLLWAFFDEFGKVLLAIPADFHSGAFWKTLGDGG